MSDKPDGLGSRIQAPLLKLREWLGLRRDDQAAHSTPQAATRSRSSAARPAAARRRSVAAAPESFAAWSSREIEVDGAVIHAALSQGADPDAPAAVLIHGAGLDHRDWTFSFMHALRRAAGAGPSILAFDRPGFGRSTRPLDPAVSTPNGQARYLRRAATALGLRRVAPIGHSWGGAVAAAWALAERGEPDAPEVVGMGSFAGALLPWSMRQSMRNAQRLGEAARIALGAGGFTAEGMGEAARAALADAFSPNAPPEGYVEHIATKLSPTSGPAASTMADIAAINAALTLQGPQLTRLAAPAALVYGVEDQILNIAEQGDRAARMIPEARMTRLEGVGHMVHHAAEAACVEAALGLLRRR